MILNQKPFELTGFFKIVLKYYSRFDGSVFSHYLEGLHTILKFEKFEKTV